MSDKSSFRKVFHSKRGSSVLEYVVIIAAGVLLGSLLLWAINSDDIRSSMDTAVENAINGETGHGDPTSPPSDKEDPESPKDKDIQIKGKLNAEQDDHGQSDQNWLEKGWGYLVGGSNGEAVKPTFISSPPNGYDPDYVTNKNRNHYTNDKVDNNQDDKSLWEKGLDYVLKGWDSPSQAWERVSKDWDKMWDEPGEYWSEQFAWEDIKETWKALTSDFGQYWLIPGIER